MAARWKPDQRGHAEAARTDCRTFEAAGEGEEMSMRIDRLAAGALLALSLAACSEASGPPVPKPGDLTLKLSLTTSTDDRAMVVSISGPEAIGAIASASPGYTVFGRANGTTAKVAVFGTLTSGALVKFAVPDVNRVSEYTGSVAEVSGPANELRNHLSGYSVTVAK